MGVTPAPGMVRPRLRHERGQVPVLLRDLFDAVLERERVVRTGETAAGREVDLPLRAGVLAVRGDDVHAHLRHLLDDPTDRGDVIVPDGIEDLVAVEERLVRVSCQEIELELRTHQGVEPHRTSLLQGATEDVARGGGERRPVVPLRVADEPSRTIHPRDHRGRVRVGEEQLVSVALLVVIQGARDDVRARIEHARPPVHVEAPLGVVEGVGDRDRLRPRDAVHVGKLEADESDPV